MLPTHEQFIKIDEMAVAVAEAFLNDFTFVNKEHAISVLHLLNDALKRELQDDLVDELEL